jgi:NAD(P)-dependent dehydrogenase (short-subunit alcohol dehydrogenase family)
LAIAATNTANRDADLFAARASALFAARLSKFHRPCYRTEISRGGYSSMERLKNKVALISGGARGQGAAEARLFVSEGAKVVVGDVLDTQASSLARDINGQSRNVIAVHLDVTRADDWRSAVALCEKEFGGLDILVNNAGIFNTSGLEDTSEELWDAIVNINQKGVWLGMKEAVDAMRRRGGGAIVNISSVAGLTGSSGSTAYHGTKGAVRLLTKAAAVQYAKEGIRVNSVHPGLIGTQMIDIIPREQREYYVKNVVPMGREGTAEEVAKLVLFLSSDDSSYCTGAEFIVDGGMTAT